MFLGMMEAPWNSLYWLWVTGPTGWLLRLCACFRLEGCDNGAFGIHKNRRLQRCLHVSMLNHVFCFWTQLELHFTVSICEKCLQLSLSLLVSSEGVWRHPSFDWVPVSLTFTMIFLLPPGWIFLWKWQKQSASAKLIWKSHQWNKGNNSGN